MTILDRLIDSVVPIIVAVIASSGFWLWISRRSDRKSHQTELLLGLAHDRIMYLGLKYIEDGYITQDAYENLNDYLFKPYQELGGNGSASRVMREVDKLPIRVSPTQPLNIGTKQK